MGANGYYLKKFRRKYVGRANLMVANSSYALAITACGGGSGGGSDTQVKGFPNSYVAPTSNFVAPTESDPNFETLKSVYSDP